MPPQYKTLFLAVLVILFGFAMSEVMKILATALQLNLTVSFLLTLVLGLAIIYFVSKKLKLGEENENPPTSKK